MELANVSAKSLEEASAGQEVEYDDYIAEFDNQLAAIYEDNNADVLLISSETTGKLKNDIDMAGQENGGRRHPERCACRRGKFGALPSHR